MLSAFVRLAYPFLSARSPVSKVVQHAPVSMDKRPGLSIRTFKIQAQFSFLWGVLSESIDKSPTLKLLDVNPICYPYFKKNTFYREN